MRCPKCGHESDLEEYLCSNCQYRLKMEPIEKIPFFRRKDTKWFKADNSLKRIFWVITNPARAFWDIKHKKEDKGPFLIKLFAGLMVGLWAMAIHWHLPITLYQGQTLTGLTFTTTSYDMGTWWVAFYQGLPVFLTFFLFGFIYYSILFWFFNLFFSLAANFSVQLDTVLIVRFNIQTSKSSLIEMLGGVALRNKLESQKSQPTMESAQNTQKNEYMVKIKQTGKYFMMNYAYAPIVVINFIGFLILLIVLPIQEVSDTTVMGDNPEDLAAIMGAIFASPAWAIIDVMQIITIGVWIPITMAIALREIANTNTTKLLIGNIIVGMVLAYMIYFLRPTLGWNFDIIANYGA